MNYPGIQKKKGIKSDKDEIILELMRWGGNKPDQRLIRLWADHSGAVMDWLMDVTDAEGIQTIIYQWPQPNGFQSLVILGVMEQNDSNQSQNYGKILIIKSNKPTKYMTPTK